MADTFLREDLSNHFCESNLIARMWELEGEVVRAVADRQTLKVEIDGRSFYLKRHEGGGWLEVLKNWLVLKKPVQGAANEFEACRHLESAGIKAPRVAAFAMSSGLPGRRRSFVLCDALTGFEDLEIVTERWFTDPPTGIEKRALTQRVARFARDFHAAGIVHRDFYLCHLLLPAAADEPLGVLDLHRALLFDRLPDRWRKRDLAALLYSSLDLGLTPRTWLRFVRIYTGRSLRETFETDAAFWIGVHRRACDLYRKGAARGLTRGNFEP